MKHTTSEDLRVGDVVRVRTELGEEMMLEVLAQSSVGAGFWKASIVGSGGNRTILTPRDTLLAIDRRDRS